MAFSGTPAQQALENLLFQVLQANELGGASAFALDPPVDQNSTWTFGTPQFDVGRNPAAHTLLANILLNAKDANGNYIISPGDTANRGTAAAISDFIISSLLQEASSSSNTAISPTDLALIDSALSSQVGVDDID